MDALLYIAILNLIFLSLDIIMSFPTEWHQVLTKLINASWVLVYIAYWFMAQKFPAKYTHYSPLVVILINSLTLLYYKIKIGGL